MKSFKALMFTFVAISSVFCQTALAQQSSAEVQAVKTGDKVHQVFFDYTQQGRSDPVKENFRNFVATIESGPESYRFSYPSGRVEEFNNTHAMISRNGNKFPQDQVRSWMPKEGLSSLHAGATWKTGYNFSGSGVCDGRAEFEAVSKTVPFSLKIDGKDTTIQVIEVTMNGFGRCSQGGERWKMGRVILFSKELNLILSSSAIFFDTRGFLFGSGGAGGGGFTVSSLEILK